jgi:hypothetical protein
VEKRCTLLGRIVKYGDQIVGMDSLALKAQQLISVFHILIWKKVYYNIHQKADKI